MINHKYIIIIIGIIIYTLIIQYRYVAYFIPNKIIKYTPKDFDMEYQEINIDKINGWFFSNSNKINPNKINPNKINPNKINPNKINPNKINPNIIIFNHGNAGNISNRIYIIKQLLNIFPQTDIYIYDYPQFGISTGNLVPSNVISNAYKIYDYWASKYDNVNLLGESIGAGIVAEVFNLLIKLNHKKIPKNIIHLNGITSLRDVISNTIPYITRPFILPWIEEFNPESIYMKHIMNIPKIIIIHTPNDDIVPIQFVKKFVYKLRISDSVKFIEISGSHNNPIIDSNAIKHIQSHYIQ
jgi:hypothetical protein